MQYEMKKITWKDADEKGYNAINSDEFVITPTSEGEAFEGKDYPSEMNYYYYFRPALLHRVNIWKKTGVNIDLASSGGHSVMFENRNIYPENFILRHYILLSKKHAVKNMENAIMTPRNWLKEKM